MGARNVAQGLTHGKDRVLFFRTFRRNIYMQTHTQQRNLYITSLSFYIEFKVVYVGRPN